MHLFHAQLNYYDLIPSVERPRLKDINHRRMTRWGEHELAEIHGDEGKSRDICSQLVTQSTRTESSKILSV